MDLTTTGQYRVLADRPDEGELLLVEASASDDAAYEPVYVESDGYDGDLATAVDALRPGYLVTATLDWADGSARFESVTVDRPTLYEYVDGATDIFEAARETWQEAAAANEAMNSRVTRGTDGNPNGVVYVFAKQSGARDLFEEFRTGVVPIEPLVARADEGREEESPQEVFVIRPAEEPFVLVYVVFRKGGLLADTVRDTYGCPRRE